MIARLVEHLGRTQPRRQQTSAVALEDEHGVIHVLAVGSVEEAELLLAVRGIVGGIEVEQNLAALADLIAAEADELLAPGVAQTHQIASRGRVLPVSVRPRPRRPLSAPDGIVSAIVMLRQQPFPFSSAQGISMLEESKYTK